MLRARYNLKVSRGPELQPTAVSNLTVDEINRWSSFFRKIICIYWCELVQTIVSLSHLWQWNSTQFGLASFMSAPSRLCCSEQTHVQSGHRSARSIQVWSADRSLPTVHWCRWSRMETDEKKDKARNVRILFSSLSGFIQAHKRSHGNFQFYAAGVAVKRGLSFWPSKQEQCEHLSSSLQPIYESKSNSFFLQFRPCLLWRTARNTARVNVQITSHHITLCATHGWRNPPGAELRPISLWW